MKLRSTGLWITLAAPALALVAPSAMGQEPAEARAIVSCGAEDDPERLELVLRGFFGKHDTNTFDVACDDAGVFGSVTIQETVTALAISGPRAQAQATANVNIEIGPFLDCVPVARDGGTGFTAAASVIEFSIALRAKQAPPLQLNTVPGKAFVIGELTVDLKPAAFEGDSSDDVTNLAEAEAAFQAAGFQTLASWGVQTTDGPETADITQVIPLDLLTNGEDMEFGKGVAVNVELDAAEPCGSQGGMFFAEAMGVIDPVFEFDQARFDAEQGVNSFPLADFFEIRVSPNLDELLFRGGFED